jgi:hypothetical protein
LDCLTQLMSCVAYPCLPTMVLAQTASATIYSRLGTDFLKSPNLSDITSALAHEGLTELEYLMSMTSNDVDKLTLDPLPNSKLCRNRNCGTRGKIKLLICWISIKQDNHELATEADWNALLVDEFNDFRL